MGLVSKESYFVDFSPVLYIVEGKLLVFLINILKEEYWYLTYLGFTEG